MGRLNSSLMKQLKSCKIVEADHVEQNGHTISKLVRFLVFKLTGDNVVLNKEIVSRGRVVAYVNDVEFVDIYTNAYNKLTKTSITKQKINQSYFKEVLIKLLEKMSMVIREKKDVSCLTDDKNLLPTRELGFIPGTQSYARIDDLMELCKTGMTSLFGKVIETNMAKPN